jgi:hypothetical protein
MQHVLVSNTSYRHPRKKHSLEPILHIIQLGTRYRVDVKWGFGKVFEDENKIELFEGELDTFQRRDFDLVESDDKERWFDEVDEALGRGLQPNVGSERYTFERQLSERNVNLEGFASLNKPISSRRRVHANYEMKRTEVEAASTSRSAKSLNSLLSICLRFRSCCSISISSSSP